MENLVKASVGGDLGPKKSVLVVDDCLDSLYLGRFMLEAAGFNVFTAATGNEAFELLEEIETPNLILVDVRMPDMTGDVFIEMLEKFKPKLVSTVPIVFHSGVETPPASKARGFIRKDGDIREFIKQVRKYIEFH